MTYFAATVTKSEPLCNSILETLFLFEMEKDGLARLAFGVFMHDLLSPVDTPVVLIGIHSFESFK